MLDFIKNGQGDILKLFFQDPNKQYYFREIARALNKEPSHYQKHLDDFVKNKILLEERRGNMRFFELNKKHPLFEEIKRMISKTLGAESEIKKLIDKLNNVECAFIFGSFANGKENINSDIDLMLIGDIDQDILISRVTSLEKKLSREINYHIYDKKEIISEIEKKNNFLSNVFSSQIIILKGSPYEFNRNTKTIERQHNRNNKS